MFDKQHLIYAAYFIASCFVLWLLYRIFFASSDDASQQRDDQQDQLGFSYPCVVLIHANWCHNCTAMMGDWNSAKQKSSIPFFDIESQDPRIKLVGQIDGYPTIRLYSSPTQFISYNGDRTEQSFLLFANGNEPQPGSLHGSSVEPCVGCSDDSSSDEGETLRRRKTTYVTFDE